MVQVDTASSELRRIPIFLAGAECSGDEALLADCPGSGLGGPTVQCGLANLVSLICFSNRDLGMRDLSSTVPVRDLSFVWTAEEGHRCLVFAQRGRLKPAPHAHWSLGRRSCQALSPCTVTKHGNS